MAKTGRACPFCQRVGLFDWPRGVVSLTLMKGGALMPNTVGLYIHIPFCSRKCSYCDFYSLPTGQAPVMDDYLAVLSMHIRESAGLLGRVMVDTVYIGGGTPTWFGVPRLKTLLRLIQKEFKLSHNLEVTCEANPSSVDDKTLRRLRKAGVNRVSLGIQSTEDELLTAIGRQHTAATALASILDAQKAGFDSISVDLLYGLPGQTIKSWEQTLYTAVGWPVQHISCYGLKLEEGTPLWQNREYNNFPSDDEQADMYLLAVEVLESAGFRQYEISNFARPGWESRHNMKYWNLDPYIGFGPGAHSDFDGHRYAFVRDLKQYSDGIRGGGEIMSEKEKVHASERGGEYLMLRLRTVAGISGNDYTRRFGVSFDEIERRMEKYIQMGLVLRNGDRLRLTPKGFLLSNQIIGDVMDAKR